MFSQLRKKIEHATYALHDDAPAMACRAAMAAPERREDEGNRTAMGRDQSSPNNRDSPTAQLPDRMKRVSPR
jgi:hypothetical protein